MSNNNIFFDESVPAEIDATPVDVESLTKAEIIPENCVMMQLAIGSTAMQRQFGSSTVIHSDEIDTKLVKTTKQLIDKKYLDPISKLDGRMRNDMYQFGMRPKFLGTGNVIVPIRMLHYVVGRIEAYKRERGRLIDDLIERYPEAKEETKRRSPELYDESEYPSSESLRDSFTVSYNMFSVGFPDIVERIEGAVVQEVGRKADAAAASMLAENDAILTQARVNQQKELEEAVNEIRQGLRLGLKTLNEGLHDKIRGMATERKVFKPGFVSAMRTYLETFDAKNITNDTELSALVNRTRELLNGVSPELIRNDLDTRVRIDRELASINSQLNEMTEAAVRPARFD